VVVLRVYKARDVTLNLSSPSKSFSHTLRLTPKVVQRFQQEAQTAAQFHHPHIVTIYEVAQEKGNSTT
jgi:serine/threonine protein kinase